MAGDGTSSERDFQTAQRLLDGVATAGDGMLADWDHDRLALWRAHCLVCQDAEPSVSAVTEAITSLEGVLSRLAPARVYDRSRALIELAEAHVTRRDVDQACALLHDSLTVAGDVGLVSHLQRVRRVRRRLLRWEGTPAIRLLDERMMLYT